ncbi:DUF2332 domain-containing protein [Sphingomonas sp. RS2018]
MASEDDNRQAFRIQAGYCRAMAAPVTAAICEALADALDRTTATGRAVLDWPGEPVADALALRLVGGLHAAYRSRALTDLFDGEVTVARARAALAANDAALLPWLAGPPQTNEAGRSAGLMTGLLHLAERYGPRFEVLEVGSSAGINLLMDRYAFDLGGVRVGPDDPALTIRPDWRGPPPPPSPIRIESIRGVDVSPVDLTDPAAAERLQAYVWIDAIERVERLAKAIAMVREHGVRLDRGDAADWVEARLAEPQPAGVTRVLLHSVVWQYLGPERQERIRTAIHTAGARATPDRPLGWVMMEPNRDAHRHEVRVRGWPSDVPMQLVALTHAHGAWVEGLAAPFATTDYVMRGVAPE